MDLIFGLILSFILIMHAMLNGVFIGYILIISWVIFVLISLKKGFKLKEVIRMSLKGGKKSFLVLNIFMLIGAVIAVWMASGTIQTLMYYSMKYITPYLFVLFAFLICSITSLFIGTSLGSVSIIGIPLMIIAKSGDININIIAGAIISGIYFGDRCSPLSSSAALVSNLTDTNLLMNVKKMIYTSIIPFLLTVIFYFVISIYSPLKIMNNDLSTEIVKIFRVNFFLLIPIAIIFLLTMYKIKIKTSISISIIVSFVLAVVYQHYEVKDVILFMISGFKLNIDSSLTNILRGGGIISMLKICVVVYVSSSLAGIFEGINMFDKLKSYLRKKSLTDSRLFAVISMVSFVTAAFGSNQAIALIMTNEIMKDCYDSCNKYKYALHLENSVILISALLPWNLAALVPTTTLKVSATGYLPYAFYLYILPIYYFLYCKYVEKRNIIKFQI